jgi:two-component system, chemotaxis family, response regulator Rcp1
MTEPVRVLLVEDNPADVDLTREGFATGSLPVELSVAMTGTDACDYVRKRGRHSSASTPDLILLDLNLPGLDGKAVLTEIKQDAELRRIPVSILTSSTAERDVAQSYGLGANCYVVKPLDFKSFQTIVRAIEKFWFDTVRLPQNDAKERQH